MAGLTKDEMGRAYHSPAGWVYPLKPELSVDGNFEPYSYENEYWREYWAAEGCWAPWMHRLVEEEFFMEILESAGTG